MNLPWLVNGNVSDTISVRDRGLHYGHGVFETMRLSGGVLPLWPWHRERLVRGAQQLGLAVDVALVERDVATALRLWPAEGVVKLVVTAGDGGASYRSSGEPPARVLGYRPVPAGRPFLRLGVCSYRLPGNPVLAGIKHLNRLDQVLAARELGPGHEGLLLDASDRIVEALSGNVFIRIGGAWRTPVLAEVGVSGVMRRLLLTEVLPVLGEPAVVTEIPVAELADAQAALVCNAVRGVEPVVSVEHERRNYRLDPELIAPVRSALRSRWPCFAG